MAKTTQVELTPKQAEVLRGLNAGKHPQEIAKAMGISVNGVYQHKNRLVKLGAELPATKPRPSGRKLATKPRRSLLTESSPALPEPAEVQVAAPEQTLEDRVKQELGEVSDRITSINAAVKSLDEEREALEKRKNTLDNVTTALVA
jgi:transposase